MKFRAIAASIFFCLLLGVAGWAQVKAGSSENQLFDKISAEPNPDNKLDLIASFEKQFPNSKILARVYLLAADVYRDKGDRAKIIEYGEKALRADETDVTAMMLLARNYAIEARSLDRGIELAQRALDAALKSKGAPSPLGYSAAQWNDYLRTNETSARQILDYVKAVKAHQGRLSVPISSSSTPPVPAQN
jgi:tetratricopeptide (TPR) repeat protein